MTRIDHAAEAQKVLAMPASVWGSPSAAIAGAQVNATLAIVEQLRIGNLIALANASHMSESFDDTEEAQRQAAYKLIAYRQLDPDDELPVIAPDIAAALGIDLNGSPRLKPGDFNLKLHPKPRKEAPNV